MARQTLEVGLSGRTGRRGCGHSWRCCPRPPPGRRELGIMAAGSAPCVPSRAAPELSVRVPQSPHCPSRPSWAPPCRLPPRRASRGPVPSPSPRLRGPARLPCSLCPGVPDVRAAVRTSGEERADGRGGRSRPEDRCWRGEGGRVPRVTGRAQLTPGCSGKGGRTSGPGPVPTVARIHSCVSSTPCPAQRQFPGLARAVAPSRRPRTPPEPP